MALSEQLPTLKERTLGWWDIKNAEVPVVPWPLRLLLLFIPNDEVLAPNCRIWKCVRLKGKIYNLKPTNQCQLSHAEYREQLNK